MDRRGFLGSILALGAAPAIVRADSLMRIVPRGLLILPAATLAGLARVAFANDLRTDSLIIRLDTVNGVHQHGVDILIPEGQGPRWREYIAPAQELLQNHILHEHGSFAGFVAPRPLDGIRCEVL